MTTEEDLLAEAYFKDYGGDLEDLDADAEEALLRGSDEEDEFDQTPLQTQKEISEDDNNYESIEYVNEDGDPVDPKDYEGCQFAELADTDRDNEGYESETNEEAEEEEEADDVLEIVADADLEFDDGVVQENVSIGDTVRVSKPLETVVSTPMVNRRKTQPVVVDKDEEKHQQQPQTISDVSALSRRNTEYYRDQSDMAPTGVESSDSDDEEERMGRGRFHSERSNMIQLTSNKKRTNIPDTLDGILQTSNDTNRSDFGRDRRKRSRDNSRVERRDRDRDRGSRDSHRPTSQQPPDSVRSELTTHHSQQHSDSSTRAENKSPVSTSQTTVDSRGSRKILINPHFKGSSSRGSNWLGDTPPKNEYTREPLISNLPNVSSHQQQQHVTHNANPMQQLLGHIPNQGQQHPTEHRPPPFSYEHQQPPPSQPSYPSSFSAPTSFSAPALPNVQPRLPVPNIPTRLPTNIVHSALGPPLNVYNQRDVFTPMPVVQSQPWIQNMPHPTMGQPIQIQEVQNSNQWSSSHPQISQINTQLPLLPPNHGAPPQRWPHSAPFNFSSQSAPQTPIVQPPPFVDQRLAPLPDVRRPPPNHLNQLPPTFNTLPPPPMFRVDAPPPVNCNAPLWQNQPNRLPAKPLLNSLRPPLFDHPPPPLLDHPLPPLLGNMPPKFPPTSVAPQMQHQRQPLPAQFNSMNNNLLNVPTHHQQPRTSLLSSVKNVRSGQQQQKQWSSNMTRQRVPNSSNQTHGKRLLLAHDVKPQKVQKTYDKQIAWRNTNIKEVKLVENLPSTAEFNVASTSKLQTKVEPEDSMMEDEETRRYRAQIELQKKKREEIMRMKEQRRQSMALERRKELMERKKNEKQQEISNATGNNDNIISISNVATELTKTLVPKQRVVAGSESLQQGVGPRQKAATVKKRVVVLRNVAPVANQAMQQSNVPVHSGQKTQNVIGNVRVGKPKPQVQIVSPQIINTSVQQVLKRPAATAMATQQSTGNAGPNSNVLKVAKINAGVLPKRVIVAPKTGLMTVMKRVQPSPGANTSKQNVQRRTVVGNKQTISTNQPQRTVVLNSNKAVQPSRVLQQAKGAPSGSQQTQRQIVTAVPSPASVLIENLALATNEVNVRKLCQSVGQVEAVNIYRDQRKAVVTFKSQENAYVFMEKYQRRMVDLSLISISMIG